MYCMCGHHVSEHIEGHECSHILMSYIGDFDHYFCSCRLFRLASDKTVIVTES